MLEKSLSVHVHLKKPKFYRDGDPFHVYLRITVGGLSAEVTAKRTWDPDRWNSRSGRASGTKEDAKKINVLLETFVNRIHEARHQHGRPQRSRRQNLIYHRKEFNNDYSINANGHED